MLKIVFLAHSGAMAPVLVANRHSPATVGLVTATVLAKSPPSVFVAATVVSQAEPVVLHHIGEEISKDARVSPALPDGLSHHQVRQPEAPAGDEHAAASSPTGLTESPSCLPAAVARLAQSRARGGT